MHNPSVSACAATAHLRPKSRLAAVGLRNTPAGVAFTQGSLENTVTLHGKPELITGKSSGFTTKSSDIRTNNFRAGSAFSTVKQISHEKRGKTATAHRPFPTDNYGLIVGNDLCVVPLCMVKPSQSALLTPLPVGEPSGAFCYSSG